MKNRKFLTKLCVGIGVLVSGVMLAAPAIASIPDSNYGPGESGLNADYGQNIKGYIARNGIKMDNDGYYGALQQGNDFYFPLSNTVSNAGSAGEVSNDQPKLQKMLTGTVLTNPQLTDYQWLKNHNYAKLGAAMTIYGVSVIDNSTVSPASFVNGNDMFGPYYSEVAANSNSTIEYKAPADNTTIFIKGNIHFDVYKPETSAEIGYNPATGKKEPTTVTSNKRFVPNVSAKITLSGPATFADGTKTRTVNNIASYYTEIVATDNGIVNGTVEYTLPYKVQILKNGRNYIGKVSPNTTVNETKRFTLNVIHHFTPEAKFTSAKERNNKTKIAKIQYKAINNDNTWFGETSYWYYVPGDKATAPNNSYAKIKSHIQAGYSHDFSFPSYNDIDTVDLDPNTTGTATFDASKVYTPNEFNVIHFQGKINKADNNNLGTTYLPDHEFHVVNLQGESSCRGCYKPDNNLNIFNIPANGRYFQNDNFNDYQILKNHPKATQNITYDLNGNKLNYQVKVNLSDFSNQHNKMNSQLTSHAFAKDNPTVNDNIKLIVPGASGKDETILTSQAKTIQSNNGSYTVSGAFDISSLDSKYAAGILAYRDPFYIESSLDFTGDDTTDIINNSVRSGAIKPYDDLSVHTSIFNNNGTTNAIDALLTPKYNDINNKSTKLPGTLHLFSALYKFDKNSTTPAANRCTPNNLVGVTKQNDVTDLKAIDTDAVKITDKSDYTFVTYLYGGANRADSNGHVNLATLPDAAVIYKSSCGEQDATTNPSLKVVRSIQGKTSYNSESNAFIADKDNTDIQLSIHNTGNIPLNLVDITDEITGNGHYTIKIDQNSLENRLNSNNTKYIMPKQVVNATIHINGSGMIHGNANVNSTAFYSGEKLNIKSNEVYIKLKAPTVAVLAQTGINKYIPYIILSIIVILGVTTIILVKHKNN